MPEGDGVSVLLEPDTPVLLGLAWRDDSLGAQTYNGVAGAYFAVRQIARIKVLSLGTLGAFGADRGSKTRGRESGQEAHKSESRDHLDCLILQVDSRDT